MSGKEAASLSDETKQPEAPQPEQEELHSLREELKELRQKYTEMSEKYLILQHAFFGRSSEKWSADEHLQSSLFNEAELAADVEAANGNEEVDTVTYTATRRRGKRNTIPEAISREEIIVDIPEEEKVCACGKHLVRIGEETSEKLEIIPATMKVLRYIRPKYACHSCEGSGDEENPAVRIAAPPVELLPKSIAAAGLVSHIITSKYCDALPLYRQEKMFARVGITISRASMSRWIINVSGRLSPLLDLMDEAVQNGPVMQMDETRMQVHGEEGKADHTLSYMWVARGGPPEKPLIRYRYHRSRGEAVPFAYLENYTGYLQTDAYQVYEKLAESGSFVHVLCLAHARRKFDEATRVSGGSPAAREFLALIQKIYRVEKQLRAADLPEAEFVQLRREQTLPLFTKLEAQLEKKAALTAPSTALGKAVLYCRKVLPKVKNYLDLACLTPDNNATERSIRPFVVGRKNWLHADTPSGAHASAAFYSLIESAKSASLEPYWYIRYVLQKLPAIENCGEGWETLLPYNLSPEDLVTPSF
jgi:transposase